MTLDLKNLTKIFLVILLFTGLRADGAAFQFGGIRTDIATTATAAVTTTLTKASAQVQRFTGVTTQTLQLPSSATLQAGYWYKVTNDSSGVVTVNDGAGALLSTVSAGKSSTYFLVTASGTGGTWTIDGGAGAGSTVLNVATKTANYTITSSNDVVYCSAVNTTAMAITLPTSASSTKPFYIKNLSTTATCTVQLNSLDHFEINTLATTVIYPGGGEPALGNMYVPDGGTSWAIF